MKCDISSALWVPSGKVTICLDGNRCNHHGSKIRSIHCDRWRSDWPNQSARQCSDLFYEVNRHSLKNVAPQIVVSCGRQILKKHLKTQHNQLARETKVFCFFLKKLEEYVRRVQIILTKQVCISGSSSSVEEKNKDSSPSKDRASQF